MSILCYYIWCLNVHIFLRDSFLKSQTVLVFLQYLVQLYVICIFQNFLQEVGHYLPFVDEEIKIQKSKITQRGGGRKNWE